MAKGSCETIKKCISKASTGSGSGSGQQFSLIPEQQKYLESDVDYDYDTDFIIEDVEIVAPPIASNKDNPLPTCRKHQDMFKTILSPWIPYCDCEGYFHPIQCWSFSQYTTCWCSTKLGAEVSGTRIKMECSDSEESITGL